MAIDSTTEPTELYNRSKRNLAIFVGLFLLVMLGITEVSDQNSNYGFRLSKDSLPTVLFFVCAYLLYQYVLAWTFQVEILRKRLKYDFFSTVVIAVLVLMYYGYLILSDVFPSINVQIAFTFLSAFIAAVVGAISFWLLARARAYQVETTELREQTVKSRLLEPGWWLNFNPKHPGKKKRISFNEDGTIGEGRNVNESTWIWDAEDGVLEIFREDGQVQNRFKYDSNVDQFNALQPSAIYNIRGQYLYRPAQEPVEIVSG